MSNIIVVLDLVWDGTVGRGGHTMCELQWLRGLERLGHRALLLDFIGHDFGEKRGSMLHNFGQVIADWWHPELTALVDTSSMESLFGLSTDAVKQFAEKAEAIITLGASGRRHPW